ncbi:MAG TPA: pyrroline-5-carboxylate reductase [Phycisphaerae bacterium]|jgi:pyrroline-5-carboxylate reductase|nr:pyrroline-5-carboxylate reductase [Phycisphaerae bacterium]
MPTIGFIGAGNMAEAIARGLLRTAAYQPQDICATDPEPGRQELFARELGISCSGEKSGAAGAEIVILAVKPFIMADALAQIKPEVRPDALIISIAAGISAEFIEKALATPANPVPRVVRAMPNTPMLVGKGMSALCRGTSATEHDLITGERIFSAGGKTVRITEDLIDAVTGVSGSGPAYIFFMTEALTQGGIAAGLSELQASQLARQMVIGAAALLEQSKDSPAELRRKVTTPKGTTQAAIETMQAGGFPELMTQAVLAAMKRSKELGK